jgi:DNA-binding transcriptional MerR regulator
LDNLIKISEVANKYGISKRTLRYYEEIGLLGDIPKNASGYRYYDNEVLNRLEQILLLKRLNFSINEICEILLSNNSVVSNEIFSSKLNKIQEEIDIKLSLKNVISSIIKINLKSGIKNITIHELLKDQIYIHNKIERMIKMTEYTGDVFIIEFGIEIVPFAQALIDGIVELRRDIEDQYKKELPLIRIKDNPDLAAYQYRILVKGVVTTDGVLEVNNSNILVTIIINDFKKIILSNIDTLTL